MKITLSKLSTKDLATLSQRIINSSESGNFPVISDHPLLTDLKTMFADYDEVYTKQIYSGKGVNVAEADRERDNAFRVLKNLLNGYRKMTTLSNYQFAEDVFQIFRLYGIDMDKESYSRQTAQMKKLIEDLEKPENIQKLHALSLTTAFNDMKSKHEAFEIIFAEQAVANANLRLMKSATAIRRDLEKTIKSFLSLITAMKDIQDWKLLYADINELIKAAK
ncbi:hypothetical protein AB670_03925 [Chryseobacterium sp. MOF25P]|uniref:DUF6261 family protein n=1 Tax=unclassified Chryseobacterium TaxID=2593645 RepID=UPI000805E0A9|nr:MULTISPECIES: DUF6261 family protein [unclassified Chryseobacterium]OBW39727.1 hypothetical protein AB670_03925 [Chryseobacterium sp. MOF25P]OBW46002.1 hypothetical protein AB671_01905 [Chryseobacterium sp. BGARF1]